MSSETLDERLRKAWNVRTNGANDSFDIYEELEKVGEEIGISAEDAGGKVEFHGLDPIVNSTIRLGAGAAVSLMLKALAATKIWRFRGGPGQDLKLELAKAIGRLSIAYKYPYKINGYRADRWDDNLAWLIGFFKTKDGRFVVPYNNMPKLRDRMQELLGCRNSLATVREAIGQWNADDLEKAATDLGLVMGKVRSLEEFMRESVYTDYMKDIPLIEIEKIGESEPEPLTGMPGTPLEGVRALGMGHIIAGAGLGRALACHGADVLNIWRLDEFELENCYIAADVGLRSSRIDYMNPEGMDRVKALLKDADIFFANRRQALMRGIQLTAEDCAEIRPGIIYCNTSYAGDKGPWVDRVGYDQIAGTDTGFALLDGTPERPRLPVIGVVNDFLVSWLAAAGCMEALMRRAKEGGSYRVHVSLVRVALWLMSMGIFDKEYAALTAGTEGGHEEMYPDIFTADTPLGFYQGATDQVYMSRTPESYRTILQPRGANLPVWLPKPFGSHDIPVRKAPAAAPGNNAK